MTDLERLSREIFIQAIEKPQSEWASFVETNCDSHELRSRVVSLLDAHLKDEEFLASTAVERFPSLAFPFGGQVDEFKIVRLIGKGGMGHVYLAEDTILKRFVALKIVGFLEAEIQTNSETLNRFRREARAAAQVAHPAIVQVYKTAERDGLVYIAMEYVEGTTLRQRIDSDSSEARSLPTQRFIEIADLISQVADAVDQAHRAGVIHRDIKPSNVLIDLNGKARLTDFGVARITGEATFSSTGEIVGSFAYMSPEQARISGVEVDHRSDIYSLGVILYEAVSLKRPFEGENLNELLKALSESSPPPLKSVVGNAPKDLTVICHKAIEKRLVDRYQTAAHFFADLQCFISGKPILARPPGYVRAFRIWVQKHRQLGAAIMFSLLITVVAVLSFAYVALQRAQMGVLQISDVHAGALVTVRRFSDGLQLEQKKELGIAPVSAYLAPGLYRVTISESDVSLEATSLVQKGLVDELEVNPPSSELYSKLVEIPEAKYQLGNRQALQLLARYRETVIPTFRISPTEVSNREYREYVIATKVNPPTTWPTPYEEAIDDLPVTGITWDEANLYCRWRGVRLPTPDEWEAACKAPTGSKYPWGNEPNSEIRREETAEFDYGVYRRFARPVDSEPQLASSLGIKHLLSNVQEYTEGIAASRSNGLVIKGRSWAGSPFIEPCDISTLSSRSQGSLDRGFRVAISTKN